LNVDRNSLLQQQLNNRTVAKEAGVVERSHQILWEIISGGSSESQSVGLAYMRILKVKLSVEVQEEGDNFFAPVGASMVQ
jgi:hypothetical protein